MIEMKAVPGSLCSLVMLSQRQRQLAIRDRARFDAIAEQRFDRRVKRF
jgi:hypothetical protein